MADTTTKNIDVKLGVSGTERVRQDFESVRQSIEDLGGKGAIPAANSIVGALETIEKATDRVESKLENGKNVTERDLKQMETAYRQLSLAVEKSFGDLEKAPEEVRKAHAKAEEQISTTAKAIDQAKKSAESAKTSFDDLATGARKAGDELEKMPEGFKSRLETAERTVEEFYKKLEQNAEVSQGDVEKIWRAQSLLNDEIKQGKIRLDELGPTARARLEQFEKGARDAERQMVKLTNEVREASTKSKLLTGDLTGAVGASFGPVSRLAGAFSVIVGVIVSAKDAVLDFGKWVGLETSGLEKKMDALSARLQLILRGSIDSLKNVGTFISSMFDAIVERDFSILGKAIDDLTNNSQQSLKTLTTGFAGTSEEVENLAGQLNIETATAEKNREAAEKLAEEAKKLAAEKEKLAKQIGEVTKSLQEETAAMEAQKRAASTAKDEGDRVGSQLTNAQNQVQQVEQQVDAARAKIEELAAAWGEDSAAVRNAIRDYERLEELLEKTRQRAEGLQEAYDAQREKQEEAAAAAADHEAKVGELNEKLKELGSSSEAAAGSTGKVADATKKAAGEVVSYRNANGEWVITNKQVTDAEGEVVRLREQTKLATEDATKATAANTDAQQKQKSAIEQTGDSIEALAKKANAADFGKFFANLDAVEKKVDSLIAKFGTLGSRIESLTNAGEGGATDSGFGPGIRVRRSGSTEDLKPGDKVGTKK